MTWSLLGVGLVGPLLTGSARAQVDGRLLEAWRWRSHGEDQGLPSAHVLRLAVDGGGTLWVGTDKGIAWYDGYRFHVVPRSGASAGLRFETIPRMLPHGEDRVFVELEDGKPWIASRSGLERCPVDVDGRATRVEPDGRGGLVLVEQRAAVDPPRITLVRDGHGVEITPPVPGEDRSGYWTVLHDGAGRLWFNTARALHRLEDGRWVDEVPLDPALGVCMAVAGDEDGRIAVGWFRCRDAERRVRGLLPFRFAEGRWHEMATGDFVHDLVAIRRLPGGGILTCYKGGWTEALVDGAWQLLLRNSIELVGVRDVAVCGRDRIAFATTRGVQVCELGTDRWRQLTPGDVGTPFSTIYDVQEDEHGSLWIAALGLHELRPDGTFVLHALPGIEAAPAPGVQDVELDDMGRVLATGRSGRGLWRGDGGGFARVTEPKELDALLFSHIERLRDGKVLLFVKPKGGAREDPREDAPEAAPVYVVTDGLVEPWDPGAALAGEGVQDVAETEDGALWFGTGGGLSRYLHGEWKHWSRGSALPDAPVSSLAVDGRGGLWFTTNRGLGYVDRTLRLHLGKDDPALRALQGTSLATGRDGLLFLGGPTRLMCGSDEGWFPIDYPPEWVGSPPDLVQAGRDDTLYLAAVRNGLVRLRLKDERDRPPIVDAARIEQTGTDAGLSWRLRSWHASENESNLLARVRLDGGPWSAWSSKREREYEGLGRGQHAVELQARSLFSGVGPVLSLEPFDVRLPVHQDPLVRTVFFVLTAGLLVLLALWVRQVRARQLEASAGRATLETLTNAAQVGILRTDLGGRVLFGNRRGRDLLRNGRSEGSQTLFDGMHPEDEGRVREEWRRAVAASRPFHAEYRHRPVGAEPRWIMGQAEPERDADGRVVGYVGSLTDITASKEAEEERNRLTGRLQEIQKLDSVGKLAGGIAHDFNNLLQIVIGNCERLEEHVEGAATEEELAKIRFAAERATELTRKLLAFSRSREHPAAFVDLGALVDALRPIIRSLMPESVELELTAPEDQVRVWVDPGQLEQVVLNLCLNARDAMPDGGRVALVVDRIEAGAERLAAHPWAAAGPYARLSVRDHGRGMSPELLSRVFEPFFTTKDPGKGTGLGLAMVYGIVRQAGGFVEVESTPGEGSEFRVHLPLQYGEPLQAGHPEEPAARGGHETVLVAEDEAHIRELIVRVLEQGGYRVIQAEDGVDALARFEQHQDEIDLMVLDVVMPGLGGRDVVERLAERGPRPAFLFSSGYSLEQLSPEFLSQRRIEVLPKPWRAQELLAKVRAALDRD
ncbi:MAG: ATP-binding protein [Planctomycetota bacterium]